MFKSLAIAFIALFTVVSLNAQTGKKPTKTTRPAQTETSDAAEDDAMAKDLKLTPSQKADFKKANDAYKTKMKAARADNKEEMQRLREERIRAHKAALTPEQAKQYDERLAKKGANRKEKRDDRQDKKAAHKDMKKGQKAERKEGKSEDKEIKNELKKQ